MAKRRTGTTAKRATLRELREEADLTQMQMAERSSLLQGDVSRLERRPTLDPVSVGTLRRFADALGARLEVSFVLGDRRVVLRGKEKDG